MLKELTGSEQILAGFPLKRHSVEELQRAKKGDHIMLTDAEELYEVVGTDKDSLYVKAATSSCRFAQAKYCISGLSWMPIRHLPKLMAKWYKKALRDENNAQSKT